jgi:hypothetical protein
VRIKRAEERRVPDDVRAFFVVGRAIVPAAAFRGGSTRAQNSALLPNCRQDSENLFLKLWDILANNRPGAFYPNPEVIVHHHIAKTGELAPSDLGVFGLQLIS